MGSVPVSCLHMHPNPQGLYVLDSRVYAALSIASADACISSASQEGSDAFKIAGLIVVWLSSLCFSHEACSRIFVNMGGLSLLQKLSVPAQQASPPSSSSGSRRQADTEYIREVVQYRAKSALMYGMTTSELVRERLLDMYIDASAAFRGSYRSVPAQANDLRACNTTGPGGEGSYQFDNERVWKCFARGSEPLTPADPAGAEMVANPNPCPNPSLDIELRSHDGGRWRVSSYVLWSRCPGMHIYMRRRRVCMVCVHGCRLLNTS
jgi:hypothetical protein